MKHEHLDDTSNPRGISPVGGDPFDAAFDDALGKALRAEDPGAAFTQRVLAKAREERAAQQIVRPEVSPLRSEVMAGRADADRSEVSAGRTELSVVRRPEVSATRLSAARKLIAAIAASVTLTAAGMQYVQYRRYVAEGERARAQVLAALRLTNEKLDIVHEKITGREPAR